MSDTILVADDEKEIRELLRLYLENAGFQVVQAADGEQALAAFRAGGIDLCLLDIMMPKVNGYEVLKKIRESDPMIPVIFITAKDQDPEKILGLELGADDYMVKPFNPLEAVARVKSNLRQLHAMEKKDGETAKGEKDEVLTYGDLSLNLTQCTFTRGGEEIALTSAELKIMEMLMEHPGRVYTKQQIYDCGWGGGYEASENSVMVSISKLRAKLDPDDPNRYIRTIRGIGYRLEKK